MQNNEKNAGNPNDLFPISELDGVQVVDSRLVAEALGVHHGDWFKNVILKYQDRIEAKFSLLRFENGAVKTEKGRGVKYTRFSYLTEDQALYVATLSRNTEQVAEFKAKIVLSFAQARQTISSLSELYAKIIEAWEADDYAEKHFEKLFPAVEKLIDNNQIFINNERIFRKDIDYLREKHHFQAQMIQTLQAKTQRQEIKIDDVVARLTALENSRTHDTQRITEIELVVAELMRVFGIGADCFVYVFYNPQNNFYKMGRSKNIGNRKEDFQTVQKELVLQIAIPTRTKAEAVKLENTLKIKFMDENKYGEWYAFDDAALDYLRGLQQLHQDFLASESN